MAVNEHQYRKAESRLWQSVDRQPVEHRVRLAGTDTSVRVLEVGAGPPVLFIHGGPNAASTWAPLVGHLDGFRCLMVDRPGTGLSEPYDCTVDNLPGFGARFVGDVLDGLGLDRADVVASSFGGHLALRSTANDPDRVVRMVQMAAPALVRGQTFPKFLASLRSRFMRMVIATLPPSRRINLDILRQLGHGASLDAGRIPDEFIDWYLALARHTDTFRHDPRLIGEVLLEHVEALTLGPDLLGAVTTPTLFLWGEDDSFGDERNAREVAAALPDAELVMLPNSGHLPWLDDPASAALATANFLRASEGRV